MILYSAYIRDRSKRFTFHPLAELFFLYTNLTSLGNIQLRLRTKTIHPHFHHCLRPVARYSFIQLSELGRRGENENYQGSKR